MSEYTVTAFPPHFVRLPKVLSQLSKLVAQFAMTFGLAMAGFVSSPCIAAAAERELKLFFTHTGERAAITFKRNGKYDQKGLAQVNRLLRDWRRNEPARMDPRLLDLVWEVYKRSGAKDYIHVVSAYRSPATNNMLRGRSRNSGVAQKSQHTLGKAMDFYIPGVKIATLRALAMQMQVGGVGYYPKSGSPFVHLDVGSVRAWPRMSRQELVKIFPDGKTMHLPADGRALPGYGQAVADYKKRVGPRSIQIAGSVESGDNEGSTTTSASMVTAMLPTPRKAAEEALALQTRPAVVPKPLESPFPDFNAMKIPLPNFRPAEALLPQPSTLAEAPRVGRHWDILVVTDLSSPPTHTPFRATNDPVWAGASAYSDEIEDTDDLASDALIRWALGARDGNVSVHAQRLINPQGAGAERATTDVARSSLPPWAGGG